MKYEKSSDSLGKIYGRLKILSIKDYVTKKKLCRVKCVCTCGKIVIKQLRMIKSGDTKSCGCLNRERQLEKKIYRRKHKIWFISKKELLSAIKNSNTYSEILRKCGVATRRNQIQKLKQLMIEHNINFQPAKYCAGGYYKLTLKECLVKNSPVISNNDLKNRLINSGLLQNICYKCKMTNKWDNEPITLQMHHINGDNKDNRLQNLCILCPNCHTQTHNYSSKSSIDIEISETPSEYTNIKGKNFYKIIFKNRKFTVRSLSKYLRISKSEIYARIEEGKINILK